MNRDVAWLIWTIDALLVPVFLVIIAVTARSILEELRFARYRREQR